MPLAVRMTSEPRVCRSAGRRCLVALTPPTRPVWTRPCWSSRTSSRVTTSTGQLGVLHVYNCEKVGPYFAVLLLHSGRCYEAEICAILFLLRFPFIWYPFWPKSNFSVFGQKPWTIIRRFYRNRGHYLWSFYSSLEGAMKLKFASFCSS